MDPYRSHAAAILAASGTTASPLPDRERANVAAILADIAANPAEPVTVDSLRRHNRAVLAGCAPSPDIRPGELRGHDVSAGHYQAPPPWAVRTELDNLCRQLRELRRASPIRAAQYAHLMLALIHPFSDGNGRTAAVVGVQILAAAGADVGAATEKLAGHYALTRTSWPLAWTAWQRRQHLDHLAAIAIAGTPGLRQRGRPSLRR